MSSLLQHEMLEDIHRRLDGNTNDTAAVPPNDGEVLKNTMRVYGSLFLVMFTLFCWLRKKCPHKYNIRSWAPEHRSELASDQFGYFNWFWNLRFISDEEIRQHCGMDALCFLRVLNFGFKVSLMGMFNSVWLMPLYGTAESSEETANITDRIATVSVANVPPGSGRFVGTVVGTYFLFCYTMYLILQEFEWFTSQRHEYLSEPVPRNYTVYVTGIPDELRTSDKLLKYFRRCFTHDKVSEAQIALKIPNLEKKVLAREALLTKLEHAINVEEVKGVTLTKGGVMSKGGPVNLVSSMIQELHEMNEDIESDIARLQSMHTPQGSVEDPSAHETSQRSSDDAGGKLSVHSSVADMYVDINLSQKLSTHGIHDDESFNDGAADSRRSGSGHLPHSLNKVTGLASQLLAGADDGQPRESGFVTFTSLRSRQAAVQMIHHPTPFVMDVFEAPDPDDIFWSNVGKTNYQLQVGKLFSLTATAALCLFWTLPVTFIASLTTVDALSESVPFLRDWIETAPWLGGVLTQLAPLMLVVLNALLPMILGYFSSLEGPVASSALGASLFVKLSAFMIIQTFFVSAVSGTILSEVSNIIENPGSIVDLLATSLPTQSTYFLQILLVATFVGLGLELLRVSPLAISAIRSKIGPNLSEKERKATWMGFRPLCDPSEFDFAAGGSSAVLYFMVLFVYSSMSPIVNWFLGFCFFLLGSGYRHQLIFNYPLGPDSGGKMWIGFIGIAQTCMIIAQITMIGFLALKKATIAGPLMFPLLIGTFLFNLYIKQRHPQVTKHLPSRECVEMDEKNIMGGLIEFEVIKTMYVQPALMEKGEKHPENMGLSRELECGRYLTPPSSEAEVIDAPEDELIATEA